MKHLFRTLLAGVALTMTAATASAELATLSVEVSNVTATDADIKITCDDPDVAYHYEVVSLLSLEPYGVTEQGIYNYQKALWERYAVEYELDDWKIFIDSAMDTYDTWEDTAAGWVTVIGGQKYVVYALGMDTEGNLTTNVAFQEFTAVAGTPSDITFDFEVLKVEESISGRVKATAKVTPSNNDKYYVKAWQTEYADKYEDLTPGTADYQAFVSNVMYDIDGVESLVSGEQELTFDFLAADKEYYLIAMGFDDNVAPTTAPVKFKFTSTLTPVEEPKNTIELTLTDITSMDGHLVLKPSDPEMLYFIDVTKKSRIDEKGGIENIPNSEIIDWWKYLADMYSDMVWTDLIPMQCRSGAIDCMMSEMIDKKELSNVYWNTEYVLYAVGFDLEGNVISNVANVVFTTPAPKKDSNITFEFKPVSFEDNEDYPRYYNAVFEVIPSNDDEEYVTEYCKTRIIDQYDDRDETEDEIIQFQFMDYFKYHQGPCTVEMPNLEKEDGRGDVDYYIIALGWNGGPTTSIQKYQFDMDTEIPDNSGINITQSDKPMVMTGKGRIELLGSYDAAAVFSTSGQYLGAMRPGTFVNVQPGIYVVHFLQNGKNHNVKVVVK